MIGPVFMRWAALASVAVGLLFGIAWCQGRMVEMRAAHDLAETGITENAPPLVAFVQVALGGFRGLVADMLFLRSESMKEQEKFFELVQLADWIVKLQPRFTGAIAFLAWNMSYNVSVIFTDCRDRWQWVQRGIELIRDETLQYHPGDPDLYRELGWIYQHKVGQILDDCNRHYKVQLALQLMDVLGTGRRYDWEALAGAADDYSGLLLQAEPRSTQLRRVMAATGMTFERLEHEYRLAGTWPKGAEALAESEFADPVRRSLQKRWLKQEYKLDARHIRDLINKYGYLDFRLPEAHAIYWASMGLKYAEGEVHTQCERMITQSLKDAFMQGTLIYLTGDPDSRARLPVMGPNLDVIDSAREAYLRARDNHPDTRSFMDGYENFIRDAIVIFYVAGHERKAAELMAGLREIPRFSKKPLYRRPVAEVALGFMGSDIANKNLFQAQAIVGRLVFRACMELATGEFQGAANRLLLAEKVHDIYQESIKRKKASLPVTEDGKPTPKELRRPLPEFGRLRREVVKYFLATAHPELAENLIRALRGEGFDIDGLLEEMRQAAERSDNLLDTNSPEAIREQVE